MNKKNMFLIGCLLLSHFNYLKTKNKKRGDGKYHKLTGYALQQLDGVPYCMDGKAIGEVLLVRQMIKDLRKEGIISRKKEGKEIIERIVYQGKNCSLACLLDNEKNGLNGELKDCLRKAKGGFIELTKPFMDRIKPTKRFVIELIKESCKKRHISPTDTVLLDWANTNGNEEAVFNDRIRIFKEFDKFLNHVFNFLGDLIRSCEKGLKQYQQNRPK